MLSRRLLHLLTVSLPCARIRLLQLLLLLAAVATRCGGSGALASDVPVRYMASGHPAETLALDETGNIAYLAYPRAGDLWVTRCELPDDTCETYDMTDLITPSLGGNNGFSPSALVDTASSKLLVATNNAHSQLFYARISLFRCELDMSSCEHFDLSVLSHIGTPFEASPFVSIDKNAGKVLVKCARINSPAPAHLSLYRCNLDVDDCVHYNLSGLAVPELTIASTSGVVIAPVAERFYFAGFTEVSSADFQATVCSCNLDMSGCVQHNVQDMAQGSAVQGRLSAVVDESTGYLLVVGDGTASNFGLSLFRCTLDVSSCDFFHIGGLVSPVQGSTSGRDPSAVVVTTVKRLFVFTRNELNLNKLSLLTCTLGEIGSCDHHDVSSLASAPQGTGYTGSVPSAVVSAATGKVVIATEDHGLFEV